MRALAFVVAGAIVVGVGFAEQALAQAQVEIRATAPAQERRFEITPSKPDLRDEGKPREADFYREDVRVRHDPGFIEPLTGKTEAGNKYGLSGWTAPPTPVGNLVAQTPWASTGWFAIGLTVTWDAPAPPAKRPAPQPR